MIFFLFPVVGMYSFHLFIFSSFSSFVHLHPFFSCHSLYKHTHINLFPNSTRTVFHLSLFYISLNHHKEIELAKKKRGKKNKKRIYNKFQHIYTHSLSFQLTHSHSLSTGRDRNISAQFSSAQLRHQNREKSAATLYFSFLSWL